MAPLGRSWVAPLGRSVTTTADIEKFISGRREKGINTVTLRKILGTLGQILSYAVRHKYLDHNPLRDAERPRDPRKDEKEIRY